MTRLLQMHTAKLAMLLTAGMLLGGSLSNITTLTAFASSHGSQSQTSVSRSAMASLRDVQSNTGIASKTQMSKTVATWDPNAVDPNAEQSLFHVAGQVFDKNGSPVAGVTVWMGNASWGFTSVTTDPSGNYQFNEVPQGSYSILAVTATPPGSMEVGQAQATVSLQSLTNVVVTLSGMGGALSGQIDDATNQANLPGIVQVLDGHHHVIWESFSNRQGAFQVELPVGQYDVRTFVGDETYTKGVIVKPNVASLIRLDMPMTAIMGQVVDGAGDAVLNARVTVKDKFGNVVGKALTDIDGRYLVNGLQPGAYSVTVKKNGQTAQIGGEDVTKDQTVSVNLILPQGHGQ